VEGCAGALGVRGWEPVGIGQGYRVAGTIRRRMAYRHSMVAK
jgi:hypothetical protein